MPSLTLKSLKSCHQVAKETGIKYGAIMMEDFRNTEVIINRVDEFRLERLISFEYDELFNEDLTHKMIPNIKITGFVFADTFEEIENYLLKAGYNDNEDRE
ncbi:hypothetical protein [uncultured Clostridium sp.]|uniref:hypothetical protein n=1 Tax=uncultured Clostridium sp. TaxID=59620 RepID=UPI0025E934AB|nr:hypothetical protein [uncultured Clostridium sp.]